MNGTGTAKTLEAAVENITPPKAREYLKLNKPNNRNMSNTIVRGYRADMLSYNFKLTGEPIQFDVNGVLVNGQHRMEALAGIPDDTFSVPMLVVRNVPEDAFRYMDNGLRRSTSQVAQMENIPYASIVASVGRILYIMENYGPQYLKGGKNPTRIQILDYVRNNFELMQRASQIADGCRDLVMQSVTGACFCLFYKQSGPSAETFFERLRTGVNLTETDPVYHLRQRLITNRARRGKLAQVDLMALFILAWKAFLNGKPMRKLYWKEGTEFPIL
jgi:hypothetical protein